MIYSAFKFCATWTSNFFIKNVDNLYKNTLAHTLCTLFGLGVDIL